MTNINKTVDVMIFAGQLSMSGRSDGDEKRTKEEYIEILFNKFKIKGVKKFFVAQTGCYNYLK